jgi:hypothetical protein
MTDAFASYVTVATNPEAGLPIRHALTWYGDQEITTRYMRMDILLQVSQGAEGALTREQRNEWTSFRKQLLDELLMMLRVGLVDARGFRPGAMQLEKVPREWWSEAKIDIDGSAAEAHGTRMTGLLVFPAIPATSPKKSGPNQQDVNDWMLAFYQEARAKGLPAPKRNEVAFPKCYEALAATDAQMRQAMQLVNGDLKRSKGNRDRDGKSGAQIGHQKLRAPTAR